MDFVSPWLQAALLPDRFKVAGIYCAPLSVWHVFILAKRGNPYLTGHAAHMDKAAAVELLLYASRNHSDGVRLYYAPQYRARAMRDIGRRIDRLPWQDVHAACLEYVSDSRRAPSHKEPVKDPKTGVKSRTAAAPLSWVLVDYLAAGRTRINPGWLLRLFGFEVQDPIETAWDTPHAVAACMFDAHRDIRSEDETLVSDEEEIRWASYREKGRAS